MVSGAEVGFGVVFGDDLAFGCTFRGPSSMVSSSSSSSSSVNQSLLLLLLLLLLCRGLESENDDGAAVSSLLSVNAANKFRPLVIVSGAVCSVTCPISVRNVNNQEAHTKG